MDNILKIFAIKLEKAFDVYHFNELIQHLSESERNKVLGIKQFRDAQRSLLARFMIRAILIQFYGKENNNLVFELNQYGKPFLKNATSIFFNASHSGDWIICCFHESDIGIDIEKIRFCNVNIAKRFFTQDEHQWLASFGEDEQTIAFLKLWTLKESYVKAMGKGLSIPLNSFSIDVYNQVSSDTRTTIADWECGTLSIDDDYLAAICFPKTEKESMPVHIYYLSFDEISDLILKRKNLSENSYSHTISLSKWGILKDG